MVPLQVCGCGWRGPDDGRRACPACMSTPAQRKRWQQKTGHGARPSIVRRNYACGCEMEPGSAAYVNHYWHTEFDCPTCARKNRAPSPAVLTMYVVTTGRRITIAVPRNAKRRPAKTRRRA